MQDQQHSPDAGATRVYCPQCGQAMLVAPQHTQTTVACPHCQNMLEPWRVMATLAGKRDEAGAGPHPAAVPPPSPGAPISPYGHDGVVYSARNRWVAGALGILLGMFGVHRFYMGYTGIGIIQVAITVGSFFVLSPVVYIWGLIEGILCFCGAMTDADGLPLRD